MKLSEIKLFTYNKISIFIMLLLFGGVFYLDYPYFKGWHLFVLQVKDTFNLSTLIIIVSFSLIIGIITFYLATKHGRELGKLKVGDSIRCDGYKGKIIELNGQKCKIELNNVHLTSLSVMKK